MTNEYETPKLFYRLTEASEVLSIGRTRLYEFMNDGQLRSVHVGATRLIPAEALTEFAERLNAAARTDAE